MSTIIPIAADHAGFALKEQLKAHFEQKGWSFKDFGTHSTDSMDYPDVAHPLASSIETGEFSKGILICGSAQGVAMSANHHAGVRAAICWLPEIASLSRQHNDANIICLPARFITFEQAVEMVETFFNTAFEGGRHQNRVDKMMNC
jgi:ribose 5-phosphate isomerase B